MALLANATNVTNNNQLTNGAGYITSASLSGVSDGGNAASLDGIDSSQFVRSDQADTCTGDITFSGGAGAATIAANSDISFTNGTWSGNHTKIQLHSNYLYMVGGSNGIVFRESGTDRWYITGAGHLSPATDSTYNIGSSSVRVANGYFDTLYGDGSNLTNLPSSGLATTGGTLTGTLNSRAIIPTANNSYDLGSTSKRWRNVYTSDLQMSNEGSQNDVDMTWGSYTIQEGHHDLFLINKRTGKKYKFLLKEVG